MSTNRILLIASEVAPFTDTRLGHLVRSLPESLADGGADVRLMMPRYGDIDNTQNDLHEVIRLSGTEITMAGETETLVVKVGRVPNTRLQVYFMDHEGYFNRPGRYADGDTAYADNLERSLFFGRSVLETMSNLRWGPTVIHSFGAMSTLVPHLLCTEYMEHDLFDTTSSIFTPEPSHQTLRLNADCAEGLGLQFEETANDTLDLPMLGTQDAEITLYPPFLEPNGRDAQQIDADTPGESVASCYRKTHPEVLA